MEAVRFSETSVNIGNSIRCYIQQTATFMSSPWEPQISFIDYYFRRRNPRLLKLWVVIPRGSEGNSEGSSSFELLSPSNTAKGKLVIGYISHYSSEPVPLIMGRGHEFMYYFRGSQYHKVWETGMIHFLLQAHSSNISYKCTDSCGMMMMQQNRRPIYHSDPAAFIWRFILVACLLFRNSERNLNYW